MRQGIPNLYPGTKYLWKKRVFEFVDRNGSAIIMLDDKGEKVVIHQSVFNKEFVEHEDSGDDKLATGKGTTQRKPSTATTPGRVDTNSDGTMSVGADTSPEAGP